MEFIKRLLKTEPVRVMAFLEAVVAVVATFTDLLDPEQAFGIITAIVAFHEMIRSIVFSPATVEAALRSEEDGE
jgi:hypothetical protein